MNRGSRTVRGTQDNEGQSQSLLALRPPRRIRVADVGIGGLGDSFTSGSHTTGPIRPLWRTPAVIFPVLVPRAVHLAHCTLNQATMILVN